MDIKKLISSKNLAAELEDSLVGDIGREAKAGFDSDKESRSDWEEWYAQALKLALQVMERKTEPWDGSSNVKFPLVTIAGISWHAQAYPSLVPPGDLVKVKVYGNQTQALIDQARRIQSHMSFQLQEEDDTWEEDHDRALLALPIVGTMFKKVYFDPVAKVNRSKFVLAKDLVVDYWATSLSSSRRVSHIIELNHNIYRERVLRGLYLDQELSTNPKTDVTTDARDQSQRIHPSVIDSATPYEFIEQHCWIDLDEDDYEEPYIVTFHRESGKVCRIVARYHESNIERDKDGNILSITPEEYFVKYGFIPSPDGGFYDIGFGYLLGPINETVNTTINQMIDSGTLYILGGGFLGRGVRIKGGNYQVRPREWIRVDSTGDDLHKNIVPLPSKEPSGILLQLLQYLVSYGERVAGATEIQVGENPGQNTPAETTRTMNENGRRIFTGIYKRVWRSMKAEFRLLYQLNQEFFEVNKNYRLLASGEKPMIAHSDYRNASLLVVPFADPHYVSDEQRLRTNVMVQQMAMSMPGFFKLPKIMRRSLELMRVPDIEEVFDENGQPPPPIKMLEFQLEQQRLQLDMKKEENRHQVAILKGTTQYQSAQAKIEKTKADIMKILSDIEHSGESLKNEKIGHFIALMNTLVGAAEAHADDVLKVIELSMKGMEGDKGRLDRVEKPTPNQGILGLPKPGQANGNGGMGLGSVLPG